jgi:hypothetical protein
MLFNLLPEVIGARSNRSRHLLLDLLPKVVGTRDNRLRDALIDVLAKIVDSFASSINRHAVITDPETRFSIADIDRAVWLALRRGIRRRVAGLRMDDCLSADDQAGSEQHHQAPRKGAPKPQSHSCLLRVGVAELFSAQ